MAQTLRALVILTQAMRSITSKHMVAQNNMYWDLVPSSGLQEYLQGELCINNQLKNPLKAGHGGARL